jgi:hypothetical protein
MRVVAHIQRTVLGLIFILTGLNGFFRFLHQPSLQTPAAPETFLLKKGKYQCKSCLPPFTVRADAADHPVKGGPCFDTVRVSVLDENTVEQTDKYHGRTVVASKIKVSTDGATALFDSEEHLSADAPPITSRLVLKRVNKVTRSARTHSLSGSWIILGYADPTKNASIFRVAVEGGMIAMTPATGGPVKETTSFAQLVSTPLWKP